MFVGHEIEGARLSITVTVEVQVDVLSALSVTVKVTVFAPILLQLNEAGEATRLFIPSGSLDPLSISAPDMVTVPATSKKTEISLQMAIGGVFPITLTTATHEMLFPLGSDTVNVTLFAPISPAPKLVFEAVNEILQLSVDPPSISAADIVALSEASRITVIFLQTATGSISSVTMTLKLHVDVLAAASVKVYVTVVVPVGNELPGACDLDV